MDRTIGFPGAATDRAGQVTSGTSPETLFLTHLPAIDRCCAILCARHGLSGAEAEDFAGWARMQLLEDDYATLRKFSGRSSLQTYLAVVIANLFRDYRVRQRGRWRASAAARRLGRVAERLERLVYRQRLAFREAVSVLRSEGVSEVSDRELTDLFQQIPVRPALRPDLVDDMALADVPSDVSADATVQADEERNERDALRAALCRSLDALPAEDRVILRMRFWDEMSVADIARGLGLPQKPLYRRIERGLFQLKEHLQQEGVRAEHALAFISASESARSDFEEADPSMGEA